MRALGENFQMNSQIKSLQAENNALKAKDATQDTQLQELRAATSSRWHSTSTGCIPSTMS